MQYLTPRLAQGLASAPRDTAALRAASLARRARFPHLALFAYPALSTPTRRQWGRPSCRAQNAHQEPPLKAQRAQPRPKRASTDMPRRQSSCAACQGISRPSIDFVLKPTCITRSFCVVKSRTFALRLVGLYTLDNAAQCSPAPAPSTYHAGSRRCWRAVLPTVKKRAAKLRQSA